MNREGEKQMEKKGKKKEDKSKQRSRESPNLTQKYNSLRLFFG